MGRKAGRRPEGSLIERWRAVPGPYGRHVIVNEQGETPLTSPDPFVQLEAAYLAATAPVLRAALEEMTRRMLALEPPYTRDHARIRAAQMALGECRPSAEEVFRVWRRHVQLELDLAPAT